MSDSHLQDAYHVVQRMLCVASLMYRRELEMSFTEREHLTPEDRDDLEALLLQLYRWLDTEKIMPHLTPVEQELMGKPLGNWSHRAVVLTTHRIETLGILAWALRLIPHIPTFDTSFTFPALSDCLDILTPTIDIVWRAELRPRSQLVRMRDTAELWDWRCRASELQRMGVRPSEGVNYRDVIRVNAEQAYADGTLPAPLEGDFPAFGRPFGLISQRQYEQVRAIAAERCQAMSWLMETSAEWDGLPADL